MPGLGTGAEWKTALEEAVEGLAPDAELALVFASDHYGGTLPELLSAVQERLNPGLVAGCTGQAIIGQGREVEDSPSVSVMPVPMPGVTLHSKHIHNRDVDGLDTEGLRSLLAVEDDDVNAWLMFADPFTFDVEGMVHALSHAYPKVPVVGGMASARVSPQNTQVFLDGEALAGGCVLIAIGGSWTVETVVSQGAEPLGEPWTITDADRNVIRTIGGRPALEVLIETVQSLPPAEQERAGRNLLVGLAMDEYRDQFTRGDFLIRNLMGADRETGEMAIGAFVRPGQTIQFHMRDDRAADEELRLMLEKAQLVLGGVEPAGALICSCNGRGVGLFGVPDHDAGAVRERFGELPVAGFFCNGEVGPVGDRNFVHGFTASIGLFVPKS